MGLNSNNVHCLGFIPEEDLESVFKLAEVYCQPSYYEGFGFPVLVAMSVGCPVVVAKTNALVEIAGGAALIANPNDPKDMAQKIGKVITNANLRAELVHAGDKRVKEFSWKKCAEEAVQVYKKVVGSKS
jgi:glycosyltransferase involved in cell wall biosynthesis